MIKHPRFFRATVVAGIVTLITSGCDAGPAGPTGPGILLVTFTSPNTDDAAAILELAGGSGLRDFRIDFGDVFWQRDGTITRVAVFLDDPGDIQFRTRVDDVAELPSVTVVQVADGNNEVRTSLSGYDVEFEQVPDVIASSERGAS